MGVDSLLQFEHNNPKILSFKFKHDNILMWPHIRMKIFQYIIDYELGLQSAHSPAGSFKFSDLLDYNKNTTDFNPFDNKGLEFDIVMFSNVRNNTAKKDHKYFNTIHDYFALEFSDKTLIIEQSYRKKYRLPRYFENVKFLDVIDFLIASKLKDIKIENTDENEIERIISFLKENIKFNISEKLYGIIKRDLSTLSKSLKLYHLYYKLLFVILKPKIIFLQCASYGNKGYLVKWAKDFGVKIGEFQHGMISKNHIAYNYGNSIFDNRYYKKYLPDFLFMYGEYWSKNLKTPVNKIVIGNPHFYSKIKEYNNKEKNGIEKKILIVSQGTVTNELVELTKKLSYLFKDQDIKIIYRLHPGEIPFRERYVDLEKLDNVIINAYGDIYDLIYESSYIVGVYSTTLFETIGFNKPIYIYDHELSRMHIPNEIGKRFKDAEELYELISNNEVKPVGNINYYWEQNWKINYRNFISKILKGNS
ncbi:MAG: hypothetical protein FH762_04655 [Firmicutes bacterium]|nr:hypothetical protein [Bacillota bacterium]